MYAVAAIAWIGSIPDGFTAFETVSMSAITMSRAFGKCSRRYASSSAAFWRLACSISAGVEARTDGEGC